MGNFKCPFNGVMVGDRDKGHALCLGGVIHQHRFRETFRTTDFLQDPLGRALGKLGVHMKIYFHHFLSLLKR